MGGAVFDKRQIAGFGGIVQPIVDIRTSVEQKIVADAPLHTSFERQHQRHAKVKTAGEIFTLESAVTRKLLRCSPIVPQGMEYG